MAEKRVMVTGAAGFIGGACVREFLAHGWEVVALIHRRTSPEFETLARAGRLELIRGSITEGGALLEALGPQRGRLRAVIHAAGRASDLGRDREFRTSHLTGTRNVIRAVRELDLGRLVYVSTTDVYGLHDFTAADESTPLESRPINPYPKYKILAEEAVREGLPPDRHIILRPGAVWGPGDVTILPRMLRYLRSTPVIVHFGRWRGQNRWPLAYVGNVALAALAAAESPGAAGQVFNVVDREFITLEAFYRLLLKAFVPRRGRVRSVTLPLWLGWLPGALTTGLSAALGRERPLFEPTLYGLRSVSCNLDFRGRKFEGLISDAGLRPTNFDSGMAHLVDWARGGGSRP